MTLVFPSLLACRRAARPRGGALPALAAVRRGRGFTMLEVLVSVAILAFGLLGVAGLQAASLKYGREAHHYAVASQLAQEYAQMVDGLQQTFKVGIWSSRDELDKIYPIALEDLRPIAYDGGRCIWRDISKSNSERDWCTPDGLARWNQIVWKTRVGNALPGARVEVCWDDAPFDADGQPKPWGRCSGTGKVLAIKIGWQQTKANTGAPDEGTGAVELAQDKCPGLVMQHYVDFKGSAS